MRNSLRPLFRLSAVAAVCFAMAACSPIVRRHGFVPDAADLAQLSPGAQSRDEVLALLPPPTAGGVIENGNLYYVASTFRTFGPMEPREISREVVAITFSPAGRLTGVERYGLEDGIIVPLSRRVTNDNVADMSFLRQLMGNLGRFDASSVLGGPDERL